MTQVLAIEVQVELRKHADPDRGIFLARFFKTGKGQYAEGDKFLGLSVPETRRVVKQFAQLPLNEVKKLLHSEWHEDRLCALLIMVAQFQATSITTIQEAIYKLYLANTDHINNWDLVDCSAEHVIGAFLKARSKDELYILAHSDKLFERRIAIVATFHYIKSGNATETFKIADVLLADKQDLLHKAVGWMLREVGKRISPEDLKGYLASRYKRMPRTMLRYAIEHFPAPERQRYLKGLI